MIDAAVDKLYNEKGEYEDQEEIIRKENSVLCEEEGRKRKYLD